MKRVRGETDNEEFQELINVLYNDAMTGEINIAKQWQHLYHWKQYTPSILNSPYVLLIPLGYVRVRADFCTLHPYFKDKFMILYWYFCKRVSIPFDVLCIIWNASLKNVNIRKSFANNTVDSLTNLDTITFRWKKCFGMIVTYQNVAIEVDLLKCKSDILRYYSSLEPDEPFMLPEYLIKGEEATTLDLLKRFVFTGNTIPDTINYPYSVQLNIRKIKEYLRI